MSKIEEAKKFLHSLEDSKITYNLMVDRLDGETLLAIQNYAQLISKAASSFEIEDLVASAMIMGSLLKSHMDRFDIEQRFNNSLGD